MARATPAVRVECGRVYACAAGVILMLALWTLGPLHANDDTTIQNAKAIPEELLELWSNPETEKRFCSLFSDDTRDGWKQCGPGGFALTNDVATSFGGMGLWWYSAQKYTNFVLRGEWRLEAVDSDTGVFVRFADPGDDPWKAVRTGHELEIGDDPDGKDPAWRTGAVYPFSPPTRVLTRPIGAWNSFEFSAVEQTYVVRVNGETVNVWTDPERRSAFGFIGLQNYEEGKGCQFRFLRILAFP